MAGPTCTRPQAMNAPALARFLLSKGAEVDTMAEKGGILFRYSGAVQRPRGGEIAALTRMTNPL